MAVTVVGQRAVKKFKDNEKKKEVKRQKNEKKKLAEEQEEAELAKEVQAFLSNIRDKKSKNKDLGDVDVGSFLETDLVDDSDDDFDYGESDDDGEVMDFDEKSHASSITGVSDDEEEDDDMEDEDDIEEVDEDDYDDEAVFGDEDEDAFDDQELGDADEAGGVFETIDEEYADDDEDDEADLDHEQLIAKHKMELEALKTEDPELYKHLKTHGKNLLNFGDTDEDKAIENIQTQKDKKTPIEKLTKESYLELRKPFDNNSFSAKCLLRLVKVFKSAVAVRRASQTAKDEKKKGGIATISGKKAMELVSTKLYNHFMQFALRTIPTALVLMLNRNSDMGEANPKGSLKDASLALSDGPTAWSGTPLKTLKGWGKVAPLARAYFFAVCSLLVDEIDAMMLRFVMRTMLPALPLLEEVTQPAPKILKALLRIWSLGADVATLERDENGASKFGIDHASRIDAFLVIRRMCLVMPPRSQVLEATMKGIYLSFVRVSKHVHPHTVPTLAFLCNCVSEIYGIDKVSAYQHAFVYIRQLAIHLRSAIQKPADDTIRSVYNWQFINCLRVWGQILSNHAADNSSSLFPLVYPYIQIALGVMGLSTSPAYFPVQFNVSQYLNQLAMATKLYIPLAPHLLTIFNSNIMKTGSSKAKDTNAIRKRTNDIKYKLHVSAGVMKSTAFKDFVLTRTIDQLTHHLSSFSQSIAFPELVLPIKYLLKRFTKESGIFSAVKAARQLLSAINDNVQFITQRRQNVTFSPKDLLAKGLSGIDTFKNPTLIASLNQQVNNSKFAGLAPGSNKTGGAKPSPLEALWSVRVKAMDMEERENVVLAAQTRNAELDGPADEDDEEEEIEEDLDEEEEEEEEEEEKAPKSKKGGKRAREEEEEEEEEVDLDDGEEPEDEVEDFAFTDDEEEMPKAKAKKGNKSGKDVKKDAKKEVKKDAPKKDKSAKKQRK